MPKERRPDVGRIVNIFYQMSGATKLWVDVRVGVRPETAHPYIFTVLGESKVRLNFIAIEAFRGVKRKERFF